MERGGVLDEELEEQKGLLKSSSSYKKKKGGLKTMPFIIVNESFERLASTGLMPNMIFYLMNDYHMAAATGSILLQSFSAICNALALCGAFVADSYLGRFRVIAIGSISSLLGMIVLWLTAMFPQVKPTPCEQYSSNCEPATAMQLAILYTSFGLIAIGAGCVRPCSMAFGADQLDDKENPNNERTIASFFNWYYASTGIATVLALVGIVYIQEQLGWRVGFAVPAILMVFSVLMFVLGSSLYVRIKSGNSLFTGFFQILVASFKNRRITLSPSNNDICYHQNPDKTFPGPSENLRFLNKACVIRDPSSDLKPDGSASDPWSLCTVEQVESFKVLLRIVPMWLSGIMLLVSIDQNFSTLQAKSMNRRILFNIEFPAGSFGVVLVVTITIWVAFYDRIVVPFLARYAGMPRGISPKIRMGIGLVLSFIALGQAGIVENVRRGRAIEEGFDDNPGGVLEMSAMWLFPQFILLGLAEAFNAIGQIEFFYTQLPKSMSSIAVALYTFGMALASLLSAFLIKIVDSVTSKGGNVSWLATNINQGHYDYFYWLIATLNFLNLFYYLYCCWSYGSFEIRKNIEGLDEEEESYHRRH